MKNKRPFEEVPEILAAKEAAEAELQGRGRVLLRYSGTESLARVMVEGEDDTQVERLANVIADTIKRSLC